MYRILSLDGGGIRGLLTARLLEKLELACPGFLAKVDLIAGTSSGAIPALGLAAGLSPAVVSDFFQRHHKVVFADSLLDNLFDLIAIFGAQYSNRGILQALHDMFGKQRLGDLSKQVLIPAVDLDCIPKNGHDQRCWKAKFFHNFSGADSDKDELVVDVATRSMSAPVFFPIYQGYVDGGLVANNPSLCAVVQALGEDGINNKLEEIVLLSIGAGRNAKFIPKLDGDWGALQWAYQWGTATRPQLKAPLIELILEASVGLAHFQCHHLLGASYHRLDPILSQRIDLDDDRQVWRLNRLVGGLNIDETTAWLKDYF